MIRTLVIASALTVAVLAPPTVAFGTASGTCWEDMPCWDCATMGNGVCGPVRADMARRGVVRVYRLQDGGWRVLRADGTSGRVRPYGDRVARCATLACVDRVTVRESRLATYAATVTE